MWGREGFPHRKGGEEQSERDIIALAHPVATVNSAQSGDDEMGIINFLRRTIIALLTRINGAILVVIHRLENNEVKGSGFRKSKANIGIIIWKLTMATLIVMWALWALIVWDYQPGESQDLLAITSLFVAYIAFLIAILANQENNTQLNQIENKLDKITEQMATRPAWSQEIVERLRREGHLNDRLSPQAPEDNEVADCKKIKTIKEYIQASFSGRCHK